MTTVTAEALAFQATPIITFGYVVQVIISLAVIIGFIYLLGRYVLPRFKINSSGSLIKVVDLVYLDPQIGAYILKVGKAAWLVVASKQQVVKIDKIEDPAIINS